MIIRSIDYLILKMSRKKCFKTKDRIVTFDRIKKRKHHFFIILKTIAINMYLNQNKFCKKINKKLNVNELKKYI